MEKILTGPSSSDFRGAFASLVGAPPAQPGGEAVLSADWLDTPLGPMVAIADDEHPRLLAFSDQAGLARAIERLQAEEGRPLVQRRSAPLAALASALGDWFAGTAALPPPPPLARGTAFQRSVWRELTRIPPGETRSYGALAAAIGSPRAVRAVARANGANRLALLVPCHRVIGADGSLTGYAGGLRRKRWLLDHERRHAARA